MQYFSIPKVEKKPHLIYKHHIKSENGKFLCGLSMTPRFVEITNSFAPENVCKKCLRELNGIPFMQNQSFRKVVVEKLTAFIGFASEDFKSEFSKACVGMTNEYAALGLSCEYNVEYEYNGAISGRIIFHSHKYKNMYMMFTYKPRNKEKLRFEKPLRDYLAIAFSEVLGGVLNIL